MPGILLVLYNTQSGSHGFIKSGNTFATIDYDKPGYTEISGINNLGQIVGGYAGDSRYKGFLKSGHIYPHRI